MKLVERNLAVVSRHACLENGQYFVIGFYEYFALQSPSELNIDRLSSYHSGRLKSKSPFILEPRDQEPGTICAAFYEENDRSALRIGRATVSGKPFEPLTFQGSNGNGYFTVYSASGMDLDEVVGEACLDSWT